MKYELLFKRSITTYCENGEKFIIIEHTDGSFGAINTKYIDNRGCITKTLRGVDIYLAPSVNKCIDNIHKYFIRLQYEKEGFNPYAAIILAHGGTIEEAKKITEIMKENNLL